MTLVALGFAALIGVIAVLDADGTGSAIAVGAATSVTVFVAGGTIACGLACLVRGRSEILALGGLVAACLAVDLFVLAIWRDIDNATYGKFAELSFVWTFFALLMLALALAVVPRNRLTRALYIGAMASAAVAGLISTWLIVTGDYVTPLEPLFGLESVWDGALLRPFAVTLVLLSTLWFGALAASRLERS